MPLIHASFLTEKIGQRLDILSGLFGYRYQSLTSCKKCGNLEIEDLVVQLIFKGAVCPVCGLGISPRLNVYDEGEWLCLPLLTPLQTGEAIRKFVAENALSLSGNTERIRALKKLFDTNLCVRHSVLLNFGSLPALVSQLNIVAVCQPIDNWKEKALPLAQSYRAVHLAECLGVHVSAIHGLVNRRNWRKEKL